MPSKRKCLPLYIFVNYLCDSGVCPQVVHFLVRHGETISLILRGGSPLLSYGSLRELSLVVSLLARCAEATVSAPHLAPHLEASATLQRLRQLTLALLPRFTLSQSLANKIRARARLV